MVSSHVSEALGHVRRLRGLVIERRGFRGYSGIARLLGAFCALIGGGILTFPLFDDRFGYHVVVWGIIAFVAAGVNYGALGYWFFYDPSVNRRPEHIMPATDALAPLVVGGVLTLAILTRGNADLLFGVWACLYGVAHLAHRHSLPRSNYLLGLGYIVAGSVLLLYPPGFLNPLPMACVFAIGETVGALIFLNMERKRP